jgi:hypothetical protein
MTIIAQSNHRLRVAIAVVKLLGRRPELMAEVRDALNARRRARTARLTPAEEYAYLRRYLAQHAPDLLDH